MKLVVNTLLGVGMQAIAEAVVLGEKAGLNRERLLEVLSKTAVIAPAHVGKLARVAINDYSSAVSTAPDEQGFPVDSRGGGTRAYPHACDRSGVSRQFRGAGTHMMKRTSRLCCGEWKKSPASKVFSRSR